jgi:NAD+ kinase
VKREAFTPDLPMISPSPGSQTAVPTRAINRVGVVVNIAKPAALKTARAAVSFLEGRVGSLALQSHVAEEFGLAKSASDDSEVVHSDVVLVFGGDGTVLATSRKCAPAGTPMLPINLGRFGFLTEVIPDHLADALERLLQGDFTVEERMMLRGELLRNGEPQQEELALNDLVVAHGSLVRVLHLSMQINGKYVTTYAADGIIVATPTGSTAYSLSAGGPLVHPALSVMLITPICAHTLTTRALLVPDTHEITLEAETAEGESVRVTVDGQIGIPMLPGDALRVTRAPYPAQLITQIGGDTFYEKLQTKLHWGERTVY